MLKILLETRYKRHKISVETRHYEELCGVVYELAEIRDDELESIHRELPELASKIEEILKEKSEARIYVSENILDKLLEIIGYNEGYPRTGSYEYVLVFRKV